MWDRRRCAVAAALLGLGLAGCMGSDSGQDEAGDRRGPDETEVRLVDCADWRAADAETRDGIVSAVREFAGGEVGSPAGYGATLDDADARRLFDSYCAEDFATGFKLYKLYTRAASFGAR
jgi:hypothetical protein